MKKQIIAFIVGVLALLMVACGNSSVMQNNPTNVVESSTLMTESSENQNVASQDVQSGSYNRGKIDKNEIEFSLGNAIENSPSFTGTPYIQNLIPLEDVYNFPESNEVSFEPGARSNWHRHGGMVVLVTAGVGYYQEEGKKAQIIRPGDVVYIPEDVKHWHGATKDSWFSQICIYDKNFHSEIDEPSEPVTDEYYNNLDEEEYTGRTISSDDELMFHYEKTPLNFETFSGPAYVTDVVSNDNPAKAPSLHNVVFKDGVYNNWHSHEGGQILIVTDGIGFHQIEGQDVEVLRPGDIAFCPPGVMHWHGGSKGCTFAHLAANSNPERPGVTWGDRLSEESFNKLNEELKKLNVNDKSSKLTIRKDVIMNNNDNENTANTKNKTLVVYYSAQNHTKRVAEQIANKTGADIFEVVPKNIYTEADLDWTDRNSRVTKEHDDESLQNIELTNINVPNWEDYDTVYIGYPIWWGIAAWPINNFVKGNDFTGKKVIPFCTSTSSGVGRSDKLLKEMTNTGDWSNGHRFYQGVSEDEVIKWVESVN